MLRPIDDHVVIRPIIEDSKTTSGIILPDTVDKEKPEKGEVVAVGNGRLLDSGQRAPLSVKVGDTVIFTKYSPNEVTFNNEDYFILREADVLAVVEGESVAAPAPVQAAVNEEPPLPVEDLGNSVPPMI
ncbi:co-chaperone GroES [Candidatus Falkowbacteria bacterium]|jgi:chaperonin GroES|nr:co-chaperone GroES [Candidatus Falkowbacteria bacterium]MBT7007441.1 co-chaperone GroES [Candidatus Falkowbacteria bacterium]